MVWLAFVFMTAAAVICVSWPLLRPRRDDVAGETDVVFYRQQLAELDADVERGVLRPVDVEVTRAELGRRLILASERPGSRATTLPGRMRVAAAGIAGGFVLLVTTALYADLGHPTEPDAPLAPRIAGRSDFAIAMAKIEAHLASDPDDGRGLDIIAPIYMKLGRFDDAARAYRGSIRVMGPSPARRAALGQALVMAADGVVTAEARQVFDAALKDDPLLPQARFFDALAAMQDGDKAKAREIWTALVREAPAEAPYTDIIRQRIAELDGTSPSDASGPLARGPVAGSRAVMASASGAPQALGAAPALAGPRALPGLPAGAAAVAALPADQQQVAIRGMVDGLAARLARDGHDPDGWLRLVRAYRVLGEQDKAVKALADARRSMTGDPQVLGRLDQLAHELGLES